MASKRKQVLCVLALLVMASSGELELPPGLVSLSAQVGWFLKHMRHSTAPYRIPPQSPARVITRS